MNKLTETIVGAVQDKKGRRIAVLDLSGIDGAITDTFVVCSADSPAQVEAIAHGVEEKVRERTGEKVWRVEGLSGGVWVVMDYVDAMVHIFQSDARDFYKLDELWADVPTERFEENY
jgi:ribosome-associated protein